MEIAVFLDGSNFFFMQKEEGWFADPKKVLQYIEEEIGKIEDAYYYVGQDAPPDSRQQAFLEALPLMGYSLVSKQIKTIFDTKTGATKKKANLDIEIVLDMFNTIDNYDCAVLISGDGDFERALTLLKSRGKKIFVIATDKYMARELRNVVGRHYIRLEDIRDKVEKSSNQTLQ